MIYIIGLALAFIFGILVGKGWEKSKQNDLNPFDVKLEEKDICPDILNTNEGTIEKTGSTPLRNEAPWDDVAIFYPNKSNRLWS